LQTSQNIRISSVVELHYLVCEYSGACVSAEFLNGKFVPHYGTSLPVAVLTNDTYENSLQYLRTLIGFGGVAKPFTGPGSLDRFGRAATMMKNYRPSLSKDIVDYAFDILNNVVQGDYTKWSIVYDLTNLRVFFRTSSSKQIKQLDLRKLDFACSKPVQVLDIDIAQRGDVISRLQKYTTSINRKLVHQSYKATSFLTNVPDSELELVTMHPETFRCTGN
jgi:penicillin V acylase-like amidase (Ntn superfamily)